MVGRRAGGEVDGEGVEGGDAQNHVHGELTGLAELVSPAGDVRGDAIGGVKGDAGSDAMGGMGRVLAVTRKQQQICFIPNSHLRVRRSAWK